MQTRSRPTSPRCPGRPRTSGSRSTAAEIAASRWLTRSSTRPTSALASEHSRRDAQDIDVTVRGRRRGAGVSLSLRDVVEGVCSPSMRDPAARGRGHAGKADDHDAEAPGNALPPDVADALVRGALRNVLPGMDRRASPIRGLLRTTINAIPLRHERERGARAPLPELTAARAVPAASDLELRHRG
jgi:hypothetical protein